MNQETIIKAAVCRKFDSPLVVEELSLTPPAEDEVQVKLSACAICHSDITYMNGGWGGDLPIVFGHEAAGVVTAAGIYTGIKPGARVLATLLRSCGSCVSCSQGIPAQCEKEFPSITRLRDKHGDAVAVGLKTAAFAEEVVVHYSQIAPIPEELPFDEASLLSCGVITGWGAVTNTAQVSPGSTVAVVGCGGVGLNCLQAAAQSGASVIVALDLSPEKLALADVFGATHAIDAADSEALTKAQAIVGGRGFDYVFMAAGSARAVEQAAELVGRVGALVLAGMPPNGDLAKMNTTTLANNSQRVLGSKMGGARLGVDIPKLINLYNQKRLKLRELIGNHYSLENINDAIADAKKGGALRNVIMFNN
ncbi:MAG: zinc-binding dehydrogenase [Gammaproteobacteria bacterium WSBS_2016_MAG_OTU1]